MEEQTMQQVEQLVQPEPRPSEAPAGEPGSPKKEPARRGERDPSMIYVGRKPVMSYVLAAVTLFNNGAGQIKLKARGRAISRAIDVEEIMKNRFFRELKVTGFEVQTEELSNEDGSNSKVSSLLLTLSK